MYYIIDIDRYTKYVLICSVFCFATDASKTPVFLLPLAFIEIGRPTASASSIDRLEKARVRPATKTQGFRIRGSP